MDAEFVLKEGSRLLSLDGSVSPTTTPLQTAQSDAAE
jgi:hypothetical protein